MVIFLSVRSGAKVTDFSISVHEKKKPSSDSAMSAIRVLAIFSICLVMCKWMVKQDAQNFKHLAQRDRSFNSGSS